MVYTDYTDILSIEHLSFKTIGVKSRFHRQKLVIQTDSCVNEIQCKNVLKNID